jgi:hypothetical protein
MIDFIKTYIKYALLHKWNPVSAEAFALLDEHWTQKPTGAKLWLYNLIKRINGL